MKKYTAGLFPVKHKRRSPPTALLLFVAIFVCFRFYLFVIRIHIHFGFYLFIDSNLCSSYTSIII